MDDSVFSSAKVRLCGSWATKLASRASDVNFTVLLQPDSLFAMLDAKVRRILHLVHDAHRLVLSEGDALKLRCFATNTTFTPSSLNCLTSLILGAIGPPMWRKKFIGP